MLLLLKIVWFSVIFLCVHLCLVRSHRGGAGAVPISAKRSLIERERDFLRGRTMSPDLRAFIAEQRAKRFGSKAISRAKRAGDEADNQYYIIQGGQLVPFKKLRRREDDEVTVSTTETTSSDSASAEIASTQKAYTVVPLVIPLGENTDLLRNTIMDEVVKNNLPLLTVKRVKQKKTIAGKRDTETTTECLEEMPIKRPADEGEPVESGPEETVVLQKILDDIEGLMKVRGEGNKKEGVLCNLNGSWDSEAAGMRFDISYKPSTRKKFQIKVAERVPPIEDGFLCDGNWLVYGELPFQHSGLVIVLALHEKDKHLATFIGECRVCEGSETVTGTWLIGRSSRDCKDQKAAHKVLSDVWRREEGHTLQKKHLQEIGITVKDDE